MDEISIENIMMKDDITYLRKLFNDIEDINNSIKNESLDTVFKFMEEIKLIAEPSIFIQAVSIPLEIFNQIFSSLKQICEKRTSFNCFDFLGEQFLDNILNIMSIEDHESHLFINPRNATKGLYRNYFFDIQIEKANQNTEILKDYILTNKFNFQSYFNTISKKKRFSYTDKRIAMHRKRFPITNTSKSDNYIQIENVREFDNPYIISKTITKFILKLHNDRCTSGGRPGIPGSIYFIFKDRTSLIMFKKGTCLIVGSKPSRYKNTKEFVYRCTTNINYLITILHNFMKSKYHTKILNHILEISNCTHQDSCNCFITRRTNNMINFKPKEIIDENRMLTYLINYQKYIDIYTSDLLVYKNIISKKSLDESIDILTAQINNIPNGIFGSLYIPVFGLRRKQPINAGIYVQLPLMHQNKINFFNGNSITYRSLKSTQEARLLLEAYDIVIRNLIEAKESFQENLFEIDEKNLYQIVDNYFNVCKV